MTNISRSATARVAIVLTLLGVWIGQQQYTGVNVAASSHQATAPNSAFVPRSTLVIRSRLDLVLLDATVFNNQEEMVLGLTKEHFNVSENNRRQVIKYFSTDQLPLSVGLILDVSSSMGEHMEGARQAASWFLAGSRPDDEFFLVTFNGRAELLAGFTRERSLITDKLAFLTAKGDTALLDAIHLGLEQMKAATHERKVLFVVSDGADNRSSYATKHIQQLARESTVRIFCVSIGPKADPDVEANRLLTTLAAITGGRHFHVRLSDDLRTVAASIDNMMREAYLIGYTSSNSRRDGKWRKLQVQISKTAAFPGNYRVVHRSGYYAPREATQ